MLDEKPSAWDRYHSRLYHWRPWILMAFIAFGIAQNIPFMDAIVNTWWAFAAWAVVFMMFIGGFLVGQIIHKPAICVHCMWDVPTDAAHQAAEKDRWLRHCHWVVENTGKHLLIDLVGILAVVGNTLVGFPYNYALSIVAVGWWLWIYHTNRVQLFHERVRSFCPYCKGRGGDDDRETTPVPDTSGSKTRS